MDEKFLCYGDYILLQAEEPEGILSSAGFTDSDCFVQDVPDLSTCINKRSLVFQILPKLSYDNVREFERLRNRIEGNSANMDRKSELEDLRVRVIAESEINERIIQQRSGDYITYGQEVQLRHMPSMMLLRAREKRAKGDRSCYKVELSEVGGAGVCFKVNSRFKLRQEGDKVLYGDNIMLKSTKFMQHYLHVSDKISQPIAMQLVSVSLDIKPSPDQFAKQFEVNISSLKTSWRLVLFSKKAYNSQYIQGCDIIRLQHTEKEGFLACDGVDYTHDGQAEVYVQKYKGEDEVEN